MVLLMSVNPGFGGQSFITNTYHKLERLRDMITRRGSKALIQVDGGVTTDNCQQLFAAGADCLVAGSSVFGSDDMIATIKKLKQ
jgi:ribulose-phosphate 3-epimerase